MILQPKLSNGQYYGIIVTLRYKFNSGLHALNTVVIISGDYFIFHKNTSRYQFIVFVGETEYEIPGLETFWTITTH